MNSDKICMIPGYAYVPNQKFSNTYDTDEALEKGTLFKELDISMQQYGNEDLTECEKNMQEEAKD